MEIAPNRAASAIAPEITVRRLRVVFADSRASHERKNASFLGVPVKTIYSWRSTGYGPKARKVGRFLRYDPEEATAPVVILPVSSRSRRESRTGRGSTCSFIDKATVILRCLLLGQELGESVSQAAVRETREETGPEV